MTIDIDELKRKAQVITDKSWRRDTRSGANCDVRSTTGRKIAMCWNPSNRGGKEQYQRKQAADRQIADFIADANPETILTLIRRVREAEEKTDVMRITLELIAVGDVLEPHKQAEAALEITGYWTKEQTK